MSTKTTFKRIALVAVAALGLGTLSVMPAANAATNANATYTAPTTYDTLAGSVGAGALAANVGNVQIDLSSLDSALDTAADSATVTISANDSSIAADRNFAAALSMSLTVTGTTTATTAMNAATGYNTLNNGTVTVSGTGNKVARLLPTAAAGTASGRVFLNLDRSALATTDSGGVVRYTLTVAGAGVVRTLVTTLTLTIGTKAGTAPTASTTGVVAAGGTVSTTWTQAYTNVAANGVIEPTDFTLTDTIANGDPTFSVTAVVTGGSGTVTRTSATVFDPRLVKNALDGSLSVTYTISVTVPSSAVAGETVTVYGNRWTVQPYTPEYSYSEASIAVASNGYLAVTGDGILWADARIANGKAADVTIVQKDQNGATITQPAFAKTVTATITGRGSLDAASGADVVVKSKTWSVTNGQLTSGTTAITVFPDGVSGEGTLAISVNGVAVKSYTMRFFGDAATVTATLVRSVGSNLGATNGADGGATSETNNLAAGTTKSVTATTAPAIAVVVKDANGYAIPTASAPTATSSNLAVVSSATRMFIDSGISDAATLKASAGTFVQHYSYATVANSASGSSSSLTFNFVNRAGTSLATTPVVVKVGGEIAKTVVTFNTATYAPGAAGTITFTSTDAAGNAAFDGQNAAAGGLLSTLAFTGSPTSALIVGGSKVVDVYAPASPGTWTITDVTGKAFTATATVTNVAAEAKAAGEAATAAAEAATDAAAEATDAANAATDAANAAAEAADAATAAAQDAADAVAALATSVEAMVNALKRQITSLTNLVIKIQKKVRA
jgi:trimeric autotransporter adhesin